MTRRPARTPDEIYEQIEDLSLSLFRAKLEERLAILERLLVLWAELLEALPSGSPKWVTGATIRAHASIRERVDVWRLGGPSDE